MQCNSFRIKSSVDSDTELYCIPPVVAFFRFYSLEREDKTFPMDQKHE